MTRGQAMRRMAGVLLFVLFAGALWYLGRELRHVGYHELLRRIRALPPLDVALAVVLTCASYLTLTTFDSLGLRYAGRHLPWRQTAMASFVSYVFSHNIGFSSLGGMAFRYRLYSAYALSLLDIGKVVAFTSVTFWLGLCTVGGVTFLAHPDALQADPHAFLSPSAFRAIGLFLVLTAVAYPLLCAFVRKPLRVRDWVFTLPDIRTASWQMLVATADWVFASGALYVLSASVFHVPFPQVLFVYIAATVLGLISHVPGGLGVFETVFMAAFADRAPPGDVLGVLLAFRGIYYVAPLALASVMLGVFEFMRHKAKLKGVFQPMAVWFPLVAPRLFAVLVFGAGVLLLFSGATPMLSERRAWMREVLPLSLVEVSHLMSSITGLALLVVARGLQRRLDGAWAVTIALLLAGAALSLLKGLDWEEAVILLGAAALLYPCRSSFHRRASLLEERFTTGWVIAIGVALMSMLWLMLFAHKHVAYSEALWWTFTFRGDAPRALRAALGVAVAGLVFSLAALLRPTRVKLGTCAARDLEAATPLIRASPFTYPNLAYLGDKCLLFSDAGNAFLMYAVEGRTWVAMGDPVGPEPERRELIWRFRSLCDRYGGWAAFYQVDASALGDYVEAGLSLQKIGEEAIVDLADVSLGGRAQKAFRHTVNRFAKEGFAFAVLPPDEVPALIPALKAVSDQWLSAKKTREKGFSLGSFAPAYLARFPMAVVRKGDEILAFANVWATAAKTELSVDLMRFGDAAPPGIMDYLLIELMLWGKAEGYATFNLGMAPLSGMERRPLAPLWSRLGAAIYQYGEAFYNFHGIRTYKEKFHPRWRPKFLAAPNALAVPVVLSNVSTLVAGGIKGVFGR